MIEHINMYEKIICDKCGFSQTELEPESNQKFFDAGWGLNKGRKYMHLCGKCLGKRSPVKTWKVIEPVLAKHPLIKSIKNITS